MVILFNLEGVAAMIGKHKSREIVTPTHVLPSKRFYSEAHCQFEFVNNILKNSSTNNIFRPACKGAKGFRATAGKQMWAAVAKVNYKNSSQLKILLIFYLSRFLRKHHLQKQSSKHFMGSREHPIQLFLKINYVLYLRELMNQFSIN